MLNPHTLTASLYVLFGPLKTTYNHEFNYFLKQRSFQKIDENDIGELFKKAYNKITTIEKGVKGIEGTGIFPLNGNAINEEEFIIHC